MEFIKEFIIGGSVIAGSKIASKIMGPAFAPIIGGMPTGIIASFFLSTQLEKGEYFCGYFYSSFLLWLAVAIIHFTNLKYKTMSINMVSSIGLVVWGILSFFIIRYIKSTGKC